MKDKDESAEENYFRLHRLIYNTAPNIFRQEFCRLWYQLYGTNWQNLPHFGLQFINGPGINQYRNSQKIQQHQLASGNNMTWDLPLLFDSIGSMNRVLSLVQPYGDFDDLKRLRNTLAHKGNTELEGNQFIKHWNTAVNILKKFGLNEDDLATGVKENAKLAPNNKEEELINSHIEKLKDQGNGLFIKKEYWKAIKVYTEAISAEKVASDLLGALYSNRAAAFIEVEFFENAKDDAKTSINLRPQWGKAYYRLGSVYEKKGKFEKALQNYKTGHKFDPKNSTILNKMHHAAFMLEKLKRQEHMDPQNIPPTEKEMQDRAIDIAGPFGILMGDMLQRKLNLEDGSENICIEGEKYLFGYGGYKRDVEHAAVLFAKAAEKGDALGLYRLGQLMMEGNGVQVDMIQSLQLRRRAAEMDPLIEKYPGSGKKSIRIGVREAQHSLGLSYADGCVVDQDYQQAEYWYMKALRNGYHFSALNIGILYSRGQGRPVNWIKAVEFWKVSALLGAVRAMETLARHYFFNDLKPIAIQWYAYAQHHKSLDHNLRGLFSELEMPQNFDPDLFEDALDAELLANINTKEFANLKDYDVDFTGLERSRERRKKRLEKEQVLDFPQYRKKLIMDHREMYHSIREQLTTMENTTKKVISKQGKLLPSMSPNLIGLNSITFKELDKSVEDKIYEGFALKVTVIEEVVMMKAVTVLAEDGEGGLGIVSVYNYPHKAETLDEIGFGCCFTIVNPYFRKANDGRWAVRVDDPNLIMKHPLLKATHRCRYCGKSDYPKSERLTCRHCKRVSYCSKDCRHKDATELQHNLVCFRNIFKGYH